MFSWGSFVYIQIQTVATLQVIWTHDEIKHIDVTQIFVCFLL